MNKSLAEGKSELSIEFASSLNELARVRLFCRDAVEAFSITEDVDETIANLQLAVTEVTTNVIRHAYEDEEERPIRCQAMHVDGTLTVDILHTGKHFEPQAVPQIDEPLEGGMGLFLIEQCVDRVTYLQTPDGWRCIRLNINV